MPDYATAKNRIEPIWRYGMTALGQLHESPICQTPDIRKFNGLQYSVANGRYMTKR
jgi:hypothetical protein